MFCAQLQFSSRMIANLSLVLRILSVASFLELWQPQLKFFLPLAYDALVCVNYRSEATVWTFLHCWFLRFCPDVSSAFFSINWICSLVSLVTNEAAYCIDALHFLEDSVISRYLLSSYLTWLSPC